MYKDAHFCQWMQVSHTFGANLHQLRPGNDKHCTVINQLYQTI